MNLKEARKIYDSVGQSDTPTVTFRYFRVIAGPMIDRARELFAERKTWIDGCETLQKEIGATGFFSSHELAGFAFKKDPDQSVWKRGDARGKDTMWAPRKNTKQGKEIAKRMKDCGRAPNVQDALNAVDLVHNMPVVISGMRWYSPTLWGSMEPTPVFFVKVPWQEHSPEVIEAYRIVRKNGTMSGSMDFLADWQPHESMREIKEWEALRETEEMNVNKRKEAA
jgi:hypothetical protein